MPTYIDMDKIKITAHTLEDPNTHDVYVSLIDVRQSVRQTPTEDVVKVTRCKDCAYYQDNNGGYSNLYCPFVFWDNDDKCKPDDYCSRGKPIGSDDDIKIYDPVKHSINTDLADRKNHEM